MRKNFLRSTLAVGFASTILLGATSALADTKLFLWSDEDGLLPLPPSCDVELRVESAFAIEAQGRARSLVVNDQASRKIGDEVLQLKGPLVKKSAATNELETFAAHPFLQASTDGDRVATLNCGSDRTYYLFDVFVPEASDAIARIGIAPQGAAVLKNAQVLSPRQAQRLINGISAGGSPASGRAPAKSAPATAAASTSNATTVLGVPVTEGGLTSILCSRESASLVVLADDLTTPLFTAQPAEELKPMQTFGSDRKIKTVGGQEITYVRVQFPKRSGGQNSGWIARDTIQATARCPLTVSAPAPQADAVRPQAASVSTDSCCNFPMVRRPTDSYLEGMRRFGANRNGGARVHAACDLYRPEGEAVQAIMNGRVVRGKYYFYLGVYALEVRHDNGWIVRYGEVTGRTAAGTSAGSRVTKGETVGYVGWIDGHSVPAMLHFELYSGKSSGPLTQTWNSGFERRDDLINPTRYLEKWEQAKFGQHW